MSEPIALIAISATINPASTDLRRRTTKWPRRLNIRFLLSIRWEGYRLTYMSDSNILPKITQDEIDPREDDVARRDDEIAGDKPPHHG